MTLPLHISPPKKCALLAEPNGSDPLPTQHGEGDELESVTVSAHPRDN